MTEIYVGFIALCVLLLPIMGEGSGI